MKEKWSTSYRLTTPPCYISTFIILIHMHASFLCHCFQKSLYVSSAHRSAGCECWFQHLASMWLGKLLKPSGPQFSHLSRGGENSSYLRIKWDNFYWVPSSMPGAHLANCNSYDDLSWRSGSSEVPESWAVDICVCLSIFFPFPPWCDPGLLPARSSTHCQVSTQ